MLDWTSRTSQIPLSLRDLLSQEGAAADEVELADEMRLQVFHMRNLSEEIRKAFTSDMGFVVDYLNEGHFENRRDQKIVHIEALCGMMLALTDDERFMRQIGELIKKQEEGKEIKMCEYIDMLEARGEERGRKEGREEGRIEGKKEGRIEGEERGRAVEIVEISYEFSQTEEYILNRLQNKLNISLKKAQEYLSQFGVKAAQSPLA